MNLTELAVKTVYWFFLYGFIGWGVEVVYAAGKTHALVNRGFLCGPICPIYGFGMVGLVYSVNLIPLPDSGSLSAVAVFFIGMALTTAIELVGGWALLVFFLITYYKFKCGPLHYLKSFCDPVILTPLNVISEVATPISMAFRHYGNVLSGAVISVLIGAGLQGLSGTLLGWLPGVLGDIPLLQIGLPAVLSLYFDIFSGLLQAFIFAMLTMLYISGGFPADDYAARKRKKAERKQRAAAADAGK